MHAGHTLCRGGTCGLGVNLGLTVYQALNRNVQDVPVVRKESEIQDHGQLDAHSLSTDHCSITVDDGGVYFIFTVSLTSSVGKAELWNPNLTGRLNDRKPDA